MCHTVQKQAKSKQNSHEKSDKINPKKSKQFFIENLYKNILKILLHSLYVSPNTSEIFFNKFVFFNFVFVLLQYTLGVFYAEPNFSKQKSVFQNFTKNIHPYSKTLSKYHSVNRGRSISWDEGLSAKSWSRLMDPWWLINTACVPYSAKTSKKQAKFTWKIRQN